MNVNAFIGQANAPTKAELSAALGASQAWWDQLLADLARDHELKDAEWNSYSHKAGWSLRLKRKERNIVYLSPYRDCFGAAFAFGDKAVQAALAVGFSPDILQMIKEAKRYAEGTAIRLVVKGPGEVDLVKRLAAIKLAN